MNQVRTAAIFGATSAIAQQTIRLLARAGAELVLVGRDEAKLEAVAADARVRGAARVVAAAADLDDVERHQQLVDLTWERLGTVDLLLVAHGLFGDSDACERDGTLARRLLLTNLAGPALLLERVAARMARQGAGTIVGISSVAGDRGRQSNFMYGAAKAGFSAFLAGLRNRLAPSGVHVITVKPGFVDTPMTAGVPKNVLFVSPERVAIDILRAASRRRDVVYTPWYWRWIMLAVRSVPERVFKRLKL